MFKVEVGKGPLMFMSYARIMKDITNEDNIEELNNVFYAILYDFGIPIGCGRLKMNDNSGKIDNINIIDKFNSKDLRDDIRIQLLKKAKNLNVEVV